MTRFREGVLAILLVLLFAWPAWAQETTPFNPPRKATITTANINLRSGPGTDFPVVGGIKDQGLEVQALARKGEWVQIRTGDTEAWLNAKFIDIDSPEAVPETGDQAAAAAAPAAVTAAPAGADDGSAVETTDREETDEEYVEEEDADGILVQSIVFEGNKVISTEELNAAVKDYVGQPLTMEEMGELTDQITMVYQEKGYILARAYLPEQEIADGQLKIAIAEGRLGKIKVVGDTPYSDRVVKRYFGSQEKIGVVKESALEKGLVLSNEIPKTKTDIVLKEGEKAGEVDMAVNVKDSHVLTFGLDAGIDYNNFGSKFTSKNRFGGTVNIYDHWWGSELKIRGVVGDSIDDSALITGDWRIPINRLGTRLEAHYVAANHLIGEGLEFLGLGGDTEIYGVRAVHPVITKKNMRFELSAGVQHKNVESLITGDKRIDITNTVHVGFNFDNLDRYLGKNIVFFDYRHGHLEPQKDFSWSDTSAAASYQISKLDLARIQKIYGYTSLLARGSGQYSSERLVSQEQFVIGGYGSVRGHEPATYIGDSGYTLSGELMFAPPFVEDTKVFGLRATQVFQLALFYDFGQIYVNDPPPGVSNTETLAGMGGGLRIFYKDRFVFKYDIGFPVNKFDGREGAIHYFLVSPNFF